MSPEFSVGKPNRALRAAGFGAVAALALSACSGEAEEVAAQEVACAKEVRVDISKLPKAPDQEARQRQMARVLVEVACQGYDEAAQGDAKIGEPVDAPGSGTYRYGAPAAPAPDGRQASVELSLKERRLFVILAGDDGQRGRVTASAGLKPDTFSGDLSRVPTPADFAAAANPNNILFDGITFAAPNVDSGQISEVGGTGVVAHSSKDGKPLFDVPLDGVLDDLDRALRGVRS